jgi:hypothetical protein
LAEAISWDKVGTMSERGDFFFCTNHHRVERRGDSCPGRDLLGPYATEAEASRALEKVEERNREWDEDPRWNDKA